MSSESFDARTLPQDGRTDQVSASMCLAIRCLARDGWTHGELKMTMQLGDDAIRRHRDTHCQHEFTIDYQHGGDQ